MYQKYFKPLAIFSNVGAMVLFLIVAIASSVPEGARDVVFNIAGFFVSILAFLLPVTFIVAFCLATIYFIRNGFTRKSTGPKDAKDKEGVSIVLFFITMVMFLIFTNFFQALLL